jgi:hypothetical protein
MLMGRRASAYIPHRNKDFLNVAILGRKMEETEALGKELACIRRETKIADQNISRRLRERQRKPAVHPS